ncbi:AsmA-like C-terminal region-containing protein [Candidatus Omnitrophota bacterium]
MGSNPIAHPTFRIMTKFLKIVLFLILLIALALVITYSAYKDTLYEEVRTSLELRLSEITRHPVHIASVKYVPFQSVSLHNVTIPSEDEPERIIAEVDTVTITMDILSLVKDRQLKTTVTIDGLHAGDLVCNAAIRTNSLKADTYREIFNPSLLDSVFIIEAFISTDHLVLRNVFGSLQIDKMAVSGGKIHLTHNSIKYLLDFTSIAGENPGYDLSVRSDNLGLKTTLTKNGGLLIVERLQGMYYTLHFDLKGEVQHFQTPERTCSLNGTIETDLRTLASLPGKIGKFARAHPMSGSIKSSVYFKAKDPDWAKIELHSTLQASNLKVDNLRVKEIMTKLSLERGELSAPFIYGKLYDGALTCGLEMNLIEKNIPYSLSIKINNMDFGSLMRDVDEEEADIYGTLNADISLKGYMGVPASAEGSGKLTISDADLGPMPILTPLLGDMFSAAQNIMPHLKKVNIDQASADFDITDRKIMTDNLIFLGEDFYITAEGYMDFDGTLNFAFQNQFRQPSQGQDEDWQVALRNAIINFGKLISKARLKGTLKNQKWDFEYTNPIKNLINPNISNSSDTFE